MTPPSLVANELLEQAESRSWSIRKVRRLEGGTVIEPSGSPTPATRATASRAVVAEQQWALYLVEKAATTRLTGRRSLAL